MDTSTLALNLAYGSYVAASFVPGGLRFRLALVLQSLVFIVWGIVSDTLSAILWNVAFAGVNGWQAARMVRRERVELSDEEEQIRAAMFPSLSRRDFLVFWSSGQFGDAKTGTRLCTVGAPMSELLLLLDGATDVTTAAGREVVRSAPTFVGETSYLSRQMASADVIVSEPVRFRRWKFDDLRRLESINIDVGRSFERALARDIADKLRS